MDNQYAAHQLQVGQVFENKYKIIRELGRGGFGMVYLAFQQGMDRHVALKVLKPGVSATAPSAKERFMREVKIISKLRHPNTVTIHDFGETPQGVLYMVLEFVEGETLKQILKREGGQDPLRASDVARQIGRSLSEAHRHGVVHRDLKPANIMITNIESEKDFVKVLDFGVARLLDPKTTDLTSVGLPEGERELIGTPRYMSPEQVRGESLTGSSDIYSLGLMLYEMAVGEPAVQGDTTMGLITQQISPEPLTLPLLRTLHPMLQDVIRISTAKPVEDRFQAAEQMADALEQVVENFKRGQNASGSNDMVMTSYESQLSHMQQPPGGWGAPPQGQPPQQGQPPNQSGWQQPQGNRAPSGNWPRQTGPYQQAPPGSGQYPAQQQPGSDVPPRQSRQGSPSGQYPQQQQPQQQQPPAGNQPPQQRPSGQFPQQSGQHPHPSGQLPHAGDGQSPSGISVDSDVVAPDAFHEDFRPTVERDAPDPAALREDPVFQSNRFGNRSSEMPGYDELPPAPEDESPFALQDDEEEQEQVEEAEEPAARRAHPSDDEDLVEFSLDLLKILFFGTLSVLGVYFTFLLVGALLDGIVSGLLRVTAAVMIALAIPTITALGENSQKERFRVIERPMNRLSRVLIGTVIFSAAAGLLVTLTMPKDIVRELRTRPNWYLSNPEKPDGLPSLNRRLSFSVADMIESSTRAVGLWKGAGVAGPAKKGPARLPAPTRPQKQQDDAEKPADDDPTVEKDGDETGGTPGTPSTEDTSEGETEKSDDSDYVRW